MKIILSFTEVNCSYLELPLDNKTLDTVKVRSRIKCLSLLYYTLLMSSVLTSYVGSAE